MAHLYPELSNQGTNGCLKLMCNLLTKIRYKQVVRDRKIFCIKARYKLAHLYPELSAHGPDECQKQSNVELSQVNIVYLYTKW